MDCELEYINSDDSRIVGWYVCTEPPFCGRHLTWRDNGNGPEVVNDSYFGPFDCKREAIVWAEKYEMEELEDKMQSDEPWYDEETNPK